MRMISCLRSRRKEQKSSYESVSLWTQTESACEKTPEGGTIEGYGEKSWRIYVASSPKRCLKMGASSSVNERS